ncbi:MAG TPA: ATP-dependent RecD-like DNA helicase, partial [Chlamydiales bacterium]|nr:ATP-dependent RecD-like DNA helicase [Chlamydiales bacterium]
MEEVEGYIDAIIFMQEENGFTVARLREKSKDFLTTVVGVMPSIQAGETVKCKGEWKFHPQFGKQFEVKEYVSETPSDLIGIQKYLESGLVKGVGPVYAQRIVEKFKEETLNIIDHFPHRLREVQGIGEKRLEQIKECWDQQKSIREVMIFLRANGVSPAYAQRIYKTYGNESIAKVKESPYQLAKDVMGIGFKMADAIAQNLGHGKNSKERLKAGIEFILWELSNEGHTCYPLKELLPKAEAILEVGIDPIQDAIKELIASKEIMHEVVEESSFLWLKPLYAYERNIAKEIERLSCAPCATRAVDIPKAIEWVQEKLHIQFADAQKKAIENALMQKLHIITGGPGTGKSTITNAILTIQSKLTSQILLAAPTGRAAKRLTEITHRKAFTIHSLLEFDFVSGGFKKNRNDPLKADLIIIDEASMIDTMLMSYLLAAIPQSAKVLFIGDIDQLPSVGAGNVLKDMIASEKIGITRLTEIFRQARGSRIILNAHRINRGEFPDLSNGETTDFLFYPLENTEDIQKKIISLVEKEIPETKGFDREKQIQVLAPMKKGPIGIEMLNHLLQQKLNPSSRPFFRGGRCFHEGDKVMQIKNNYNKKVYNGDIGKIAQIDMSEQKLTVTFDDKIVPYEFAELDEISLAYAVSVHKY